MSIFARRRSALVGIDLGPDAVRLLQLTHGDAGLQVSHYACEPLPPGAVVEGQIADVKSVGTAIAQARKRSGTQARYAVVALSAPVAVLRLVSIPAGLDEADLEARLEIEAARILPAANGPLYLDFEVLEPITDVERGCPGLTKHAGRSQGSQAVPPHPHFPVQVEQASPYNPITESPSDQMQVMLAIARSAPVNRCVAALKRGGLRTSAVDVEALALARALAVLVDQPLPPEQVITLNRHIAALPEAATSVLAQTVPPEDIENAAPALLLACGLALWEPLT